MTHDPFDIKSRQLASAGVDRIEWAFSEMPVIQLLWNQFKTEQPVKNLKISACLHITSETANLARVLKAGGADIVLCASNPLSTQDEVAAALVAKYDIPVFAIRGENKQLYYQHINAAIDHQPQITLDDGADLVSEIHSHRPELITNMIGGTEETTTGVVRLRAMARDGVLQYPIVAVNDAMTKHLFDNRYGTGQSTLDGIIRATNILLASKVFTVVGYGWCGKGIAMRARGHGAQVIIAEVEPLRALEAAMDGYQVMPLEKAAERSDFIVTATGDKHVIDKKHLAVMKSGCVLANSGHFNVEINLPALETLSTMKVRRRDYIDEYHLVDGRILRVLTEGRLVNLSAAEGHPAAVMDMSFSNQALTVSWLYANGKSLKNQVHSVPERIDNEVAKLKLNSMGIHIDNLTSEQHKYLQSWREGT